MKKTENNMTTQNPNPNNAANAGAPAEKSRGDTVFGALGDFGLNDAADIQVFSEPEEEKQGDPVKVAETNEIERAIYYKSFKCPVCNTESKLPAIRSSSVRLIETDTDFMPVYKDPNPLYYFVVFCQFCGFAAMPTAIKNMTSKQKQLIRDKISATWKFNKKYPSYYNPETAIEIHKLALYNAVVSDEKDSIRSIISLHIGWLYRILRDAGNEKIFLGMAREGFERAYINELGAVAGLDKSNQQYLIGELLRRTGDGESALNWFRLVLVDREANYKVKEMARDRRDQILASKGP